MLLGFDFVEPQLSISALYNKIVIMSFYYRKFCTFAGCMRIVCKISTLFVALLVLGACRNSFGYRAGDELVASVDDAYLYRSELAAMMPSGVAEADSVTCANAFISKWIVEQLKQQEAETLFSASEADIEKKVEEYRRSLLVQRLDRYYLDAEPCEEISDKDIAEYYNENKSNFRMTQAMVKGEIAAIDDNYRRREQMVQWFGSSQSEQRQDFAESCRKNNFPYLQFETWVPFSDFQSNLPLLRSSNHEKMLENRGVQKIHYNKTYYYFRITQVLNEGDVMPLDMASENIRQILINRHNTEVLRRQEEKMMNNAISLGRAQVYDEK